MHNVPTSAPHLGRGEGNINASGRIKNDEQSVRQDEPLIKQTSKFPNSDPSTWRESTRQRQPTHEVQSAKKSAKGQKCQLCPQFKVCIEFLTQSNLLEVKYKARTSRISSQSWKNMCTSARISVVSTSLHRYRASNSDLSTWMRLEWRDKQDGQVKFCKKMLKMSVMSTLSCVHKTRKVKK